MKHIPNILTSLRIVLTGVFVWLFFDALKVSSDPANSVGGGAFWIPLLIYAIAFLTDILDGFLARTFGWVTPVGKILDPAADKIMAVSALVCILIGKTADAPMTEIGVAYIVLFALVIAKELLMFIGGAIMLKKHRVAYADWFGKIATGILTAGVILTLLSFAIPVIEPWNLFVLYLAVILSYIAMIHYAKTQLFTKNKPEQESPEEKELFKRVDRVISRNISSKNEETLSK